jgi:hypothetical protein
MRLRRLAIFSGFTSRAIEDARRQLQPSQIVIAQGPQLKGQVDEKYFNQIVESASFNLNSLGGSDFLIDALLVSCLYLPVERELERKAFFPALRRVQLAPELRGDVHAGLRIANSVIAAFKCPESDGLRRLTRSGTSAVCLLPFANVRRPRFAVELGAMYNMASARFSSRLDKDIRRMRGGRGLRIGALEYRGCENDASHPIRRKSNHAQCDLAAALRLGFSVPERFEFDIRCDHGLGGKTFYHCDGRREAVPHGVSHLNMRINGDFEAT